MDSECCTCSSTTTRNAQSWVWKHFTIERQPAAKERFPPAKCKLCHKVVSRARGTTHPKAAVSRQISFLLFLMCDARFFRPELSKPLMGSPELCFGLPPNFSEENVKEAIDLLVSCGNNLKMQQVCT